MEPAPENVTGEVVENHVFKHEIDWGHVAIAVMVIYVAWKSAQLLEQGKHEDDGEFTGR